MSCTDVFIGHRQNCTHGASGLIVCALSVFTRADFSVGSGAAAKSLGILLHGQDNCCILHSCLRAYMISSQATGVIAGEDTGGIKTVQLTGQAGWMLATLDGSPKGGQLLGELESDKREKP